MANFTLTVGVHTVAGGTADDTVNATAATLNAGDSLTGGAGTDTLVLVGGSTYRIDQLATFTGFERIRLDNATNASAQLTLGNQPIEVDAIGSLSIQATPSNWNGSNIINGDISRPVFMSFNNNGVFPPLPVTYDLTSNTFSHVTIGNVGDQVTLLINNADAAGIQSIFGFGQNAKLATAGSTLDLSHTTVGGLPITSTNALGTAFTVGDLGTAFQIAGGAGQDTITASGFSFTADQRNTIFATGSVEKIVDQTGTYTVDTATVDTAPTITSNGGGDTATISIAENSSAVTMVTATDPDAGQMLSYSIAGGADAAFFGIDATTGALAFRTAPNFEAPADTGANNIYDVTVQASDGHGGTDTQAIAVTVRNVTEGPTFELAAFGPGAGGWSSDDTYPRQLADVNGDGKADIVGFAGSGVVVALATGDGHFAQPTFELAAFGPGAGGWSSDDTYPRQLADVNGDGKADIVGFASSGVVVALATGNGHFAQPTFELAAFGPGAGGWSSDDTYPRQLADVNGDGKADIVGFASSGVVVALATGDGHFAQPIFELAAFGPAAGGWSSDDTYPRQLADVNGDGKADIAGFADSGVWVALATGDGHFAQPTFELAAFGPAAGGWSSDNTYPRQFADVNGDGKADIAGFADSGVWVALATGDGHFAQPIFELAAFGPAAGGWSSDNTYPRQLADVTGDGNPDIVGFGSAGVVVSQASDFLTGTGNTLTGTDASDTFVFAPNFGQNTITNFNVQNDTLELPKSEFADLAAVLADAHQNGTDTIIAHDAHDIITLHNVSLSQLHDSHILLV